MLSLQIGLRHLFQPVEVHLGYHLDQLVFDGRGVSVLLGRKKLFAATLKVIVFISS